MADFRIATLDEYKTLHPDNDIIPPLVTDDGDVSAIGTAHGRTIPVVGSTRPPAFDVSLHPFNGGKTRIYADDADDVLAVICGEDYQRQLTRCRDLVDQYNALADDDSVEADKTRREIQRDFDAETTFLVLIRGTVAHTGRAVAQGHINDAARQDGTWDALSDEEQNILTAAADTTSERAPIGVLQETTFINPDYPDQSVVGMRGTWTADVALVLNDADYYPWTEIPAPQSITQITGPDGEVYEDTTSELNLRRIRVANAEDLLDDLDTLGAMEMTVRPVVPVDPLYRGGYAESVNERVQRNRSAATTSSTV